MRKEFRYLFIISLLVLLAACSPQASEPTLTSTASIAPTIEPTNTPAPTETPEPTATFTLEPSATLEPTETEVPTEVGTTEAIQTEAATAEVEETPAEATTAAGEGTPTQTREPVSEMPSLDEIDTRIWEVDQMEQIYIPAGEFIMGSDDIEAQNSTENGRAYPEQPVHTPYVEGYWIDKYEVTNRQYALCVDAGVCEPPYLNKSETRSSYFDNPEFGDYPVIWVSWYMATEYCEWAGRRLPTEAEWEKASRGTDGRKYPWGDDPVSGEYANFCDVNCPRDIANPNFDDGHGDTAPVGSYPAGASPYGVMDMSGNVWEWTSTIIQDYPYDATDGRENQERYVERVWRGGPWSNGYWWIRSTVRYRSIPTYWYVNLGFRCASTE